ncbi:MAG TPA: thermonuclease family protein [bacterium]|nr:thermonuclease family protein [bacterium]
MFSKNKLWFLFFLALFLIFAAWLINLRPDNWAILAAKIPLIPWSQDQERSIAVARVIDGDTIELATGEIVRYIGIDASEMNYYSSQAKECFAQEATNRNQELVEGKTVRLEKDETLKDDYGRLLRYVYVGDQLVNLMLIEEGFARFVDYPGNDSHNNDFSQAQERAKTAQRGLWLACQ